MSLKLKWALLLGIFLIVGGTALVVGFAVAGFDVIGWFATKPAFITYFFVGAYLFFLSWVLLQDYVFRK